MLELYTQQAIYETLSDSVVVMSLVTGVYDIPQQSLDSGLAADFPYITIGELNTIEWDTDTELGGDITLTIHVWDRSRNSAATREIQAAIYDALHRSKPAMQCYTCIGINFLSSDAFQDSDNITTHGTQLFQLKIERS